MYTVRRLGELLTHTPRKYDPLNDLLLGEIKLKKAKVGNETVHFLAVKLKSTKVIPVIVRRAKDRITVRRRAGN